MDNIFLHLLNISMTASWIVLAVVLLRFALKKAPKWIVCLLWAVVGLRLIMPFSLESTLSLLPDREVIDTDTHQVQTGIESIDNAVNDYLDHFTDPVPGDSWADVPAVSVPEPVKTVGPVTVISGIWAAGMAFMAVYSVIAWLLLRRRVREAVPCRDNIYFSDQVDSAFILGVFRPHIYLSAALSEAQMGYVIGHEKAHLVRRDHLWKPLGFVLLTVYWFNPVMWLAYILLCRDIELACDEKAIQNMDLESKKGYSEALMACSIQRKMIAACPVAFGEVGVKERIKSVANYRKPAFWIVVAAITACIVTAVCFLTDPVEKGYTYQEVTAAYEALKAEWGEEEAIAESSKYRAYAELFRMISQGARSEAGRFSELTREITGVQSSQVFELAARCADECTRLADSADPDNYDVWLGSISDSQVELRLKCLEGMRYSVRVIEIGDWLSTTRALPYQGEYGNYLVEISFEDAAVSGSHTDTQSPDRTDFLRGPSCISGNGKLDLRLSQFGTDGRTERIYVGSDCPFSVEEKTGVEINWPSGEVSVILDFTEYMQMEPGTALAEPVVFPFAPARTTIRALPETYDASDLVWPYWQQQFRFHDMENTEFYVSIPYIYPFSEDVFPCQREIYELIRSEGEWPFSLLTEHKQKAVLLDKPKDSFFETDPNKMCYSYHTGIYQDVLSIAVRINGTDVPRSNYYTYYLDLNTGKRLTQEEAQAKYAVDRADIRSAVEAYVHEIYPQSDSWAQELVKKTLSDENIDGCRLFCTEDGRLMIAAEIYTAGSVEKVETLITLPV